MPTDDEPPVKKPKVSFAPEVKENLVFSPKTKPHSSTLRKKWFEYSRSGEYARLKQELLLYQKQGGILESFFKKEGEVLLSWALINMVNPEILNFIVNQIPMDLIKSILERDDCDLFCGFLMGKSIMEEHQQLDEEGFESFVKKIEILLKLNLITIKELLGESLDNPKLKQKIRLG